MSKFDECYSISELPEVEQEIVASVYRELRLKSNSFKGADDTSEGFEKDEILSKRYQKYMMVLGDNYEIGIWYDSEGNYTHKLVWSSDEYTIDK